MRLTCATLTLCLLTAALPALASAHLTHPPCTEPSTTVLDTPVLHVDAYAGSCVGVVASIPRSACLGGVHEHVGGVHVLALYDGQCQTGVIVETPPGANAGVQVLP